MNLPPVPKMKDATEERKAQLEAELRFQKERFAAASRIAMEAIRTDLSPANWIRTYPGGSAMFILLGGYVAARMIRRRRLSLTEPAASNEAA